MEGCFFLDGELVDGQVVPWQGGDGGEFFVPCAGRITGKATDKVATCRPLMAKDGVEAMVNIVNGVGASKECQSFFVIGLSA